jgi:Cys-tRNA(Pro) deacylase
MHILIFILKTPLLYSFYPRIATVSASLCRLDPKILSVACVNKKVYYFSMKVETIPMTMAIRALKAAKVDYKLFTYDYTPHGGTIQCAQELGVDHHATIKTIILEDETKKPFVCLMHGDAEISVKNLARVRGVKTVTPCTPETADRHSGYHVGGTSPFGTKKRMKVYIESTIFDLPLIYINAGHRGICTAITPDVLETVLPETERVNVAII